ncbi:MAG: ATP-binding cassette domain-containing protein [Spirochaetales bacterium]|nr:MAG: ATP-binding cassette domain-containing protein [Spirochaetales bacterium]
MALIEVRSLTFSYPTSAAPVLSGIDLSIEAGEYVAVVGANGSGKSTLARCLNGLLKPPVGSVNIGGFDPALPNQVFDVRKQLSLVFQSPPDQIVASVVEEDVAFGLENLGIPKPEMDRRVDRALTVTGLLSERRRPPRFLSAGQQQRLALAGALAMEPGCIVFDEATAMIDPAGRVAILDLMDELAGSGTSIVHITHDMAEAARASRIVVLAAGKIAHDGSAVSLFSRHDLISLGLEAPESMVIARALGLPAVPGESARSLGLRIAAGLPGIRARGDAGLPESDTPVAKATRAVSSAGADDTASAAYRVQEAAFTYLAGTANERSALTDINLVVGRGTTLAVIGATGSGKSTLLQILAALAAPAAGHSSTFGFDISDAKTDLRTLRMRSPLAVQRPETAIFELYTGDEVAFGPRNQGLTGEALVKRVRTGMELVGLPFKDFRDIRCRALSGGQKRRLALASILSMDPDGLVLDEPDSALDPVSRESVMEAIFDTTRNGKTLVYSTHSMEEAVRADKICVMVRGRLAALGSPADIFGADWDEEWGLGRPFTAEVAYELHKAGLDRFTGIVNATDLLRAVRAAPSVASDIAVTGGTTR